MRSVISTAAIVMAASFTQIDRISYSPLVASASARADVYSSGAEQERVAGIISAARQALGGDDKLTSLKGLTAEGPFRRAMGPRDFEGTATVTIERPGRMKRVEEMQMGGMVGGPTIERISVLDGATAWDDTANRGGMGGGMRIVMRGPGEGPGPGGGAGLTPEQMNEARVRRMRVQLQRLTAALLVESSTPWLDAGVAESPEGKADILETKEETGRTLRLFIDQATHLPLMVQYQDPKPMMMINPGPGPGPGRGPGRGPGGPGGPGGPPPTPEEMQRRAADMQRTPPPLGTFAMHLGDYKKVDGIMLPHKIETSIDGDPNEEWTVEKYKVNPQIKPDTWEKK